MTRAPDSTPPGDDDDLQFDRADYSNSDTPSAAPASATCVVCHQPIADQYFTVNQTVVCPNCVEQMRASLTGGSGLRRFLAALVWGVGAGILGSILWFVVRKTTGYAVGLIAIVVGLAVGAAVRRGAQGRGGLLYQLLAVFLTYSSIVSNYVPDVYVALRDYARNERNIAATQPATTQPAAATASDTQPAATQPAIANVQSTDPHDDGSPSENASPLKTALLLLLFVILLFAFAFVAPILMGFQNIIGLLIIAFALWEAWKINKRPHFDAAGPFSIGTPQPPPPQPPAIPR